MTSSRVARASFWAIAGGMSQYLITFGLLVYLARILSPRDFGLMATITIGLDLGMQIARWGQVELLQQGRYKTDEARNQAFRISIAIALCFAAIFVVVAPALARAYESPELATMLYLCAPVFLFSSASATAEGILRSEFRFQTLAYRGSVTALIGGAVAIWLAVSGYGALALAAQRFVQAAISVVWVWSAVAWRPKFRTK
jgi:PST family polysaccharide transporter